MVAGRSTEHERGTATEHRRHHTELACPVRRVRTAPVLCVQFCEKVVVELVVGTVAAAAGWTSPSSGLAVFAARAWAAFCNRCRLRWISECLGFLPMLTDALRQRPHLHAASASALQQITRQGESAITHRLVHLSCCTSSVCTAVRSALGRGDHIHDDGC